MLIFVIISPFQCVGSGWRYQMVGLVVRVFSARSKIRVVKEKGGVAVIPPFFGFGRVHDGADRVSVKECMRTEEMDRRSITTETISLSSDIESKFGSLISV